MLARHGKTPVAWMHELGVLGPSTILGHAIIVGGFSWTNYPAGDLTLMGLTGDETRHISSARRKAGLGEAPEVRRGRQGEGTGEADTMPTSSRPHRGGEVACTVW